MLSAGMVKTSGMIGYPKDRDDPCGWRKLLISYTALLSSSTWRTHAIHHHSSYMHMTRPLMSSSASSLSKVETHSLEADDSE